MIAPKQMEPMSTQDRIYGGADYGEPRPQRVWLKRLAGGVGLLGCCLLLGCLFTYHAEEVGWRFLNPAGCEQAAAHPCTNLLGVCGMYVAGLLYKLLGAGAVYGACLAMAPTGAQVLRPQEPRLGQWVALAVMLLTACACLSVQPWLLIEWAQRLCLTTPGGSLGYLDGTCVAEALLGKSWALCLLVVVHAVALIYFAGFTPKRLYHAEKEDLTQIGRRWLEKRRRAREERRRQRDWGWQSPLAEPEPTPQPPVSRTLPGWEEPRYPAEPQPTSRQTPPQPRRAPTAMDAAPAEQVLPPRQRVVAWTPPEEAEKAEPPAMRAPEPPPRAPRLVARAVAPRSKPDNILDLMQQVEDRIERESNDYGEEDAAGLMPINQHTQDAIARHFGYAPQEKPQPAAAAQRKAPAPAPAPKPAPAPVAAPRAVRTSSPVAAAPRTPADVENGDYPLPPYELLNYEPVPVQVREAAQAEMLETQAIIADTLESFRINVQLGEITRGPSVTRYEFSVPRGQSVKAVAGKRNDLMAATQSRSVNILAPIPGKSTVGVELENSVKEAVYLRELLQSEAFHSPKMRIPVALGKDVYGNPVIGDLAAMPHVLVAGSTGSGKSVCINSMLISMLYKFRPDELKLVLVDPKVVEMQPYKKLPHLAVPVVTDPGRVIGALRWAVNEMEHRYKYFSKTGVRNLEDFNNRPPDALLPDDEPEAVGEEPLDMRTADAIVREIEDSQGADIPDEDEPEQGELDYREDEPLPAKLPYIVIVIDELADLMMQVKEDLENYIGRLTQKARAAGIHLIVATQSPRAQVVTGIIKTNLPSRIALKVSSQLDSRVILDEGGAENLLGRGDLLFLPPGGPSKMTRAQGAFVSDAEIASIIQFCAAHAKQSFVQSATAALSEDAPTPSSSGGRGGRGGYEPGGGGDANEELYTRCVNLVVTERKASITLLQRRFRIGYGKAAEIMELMEQRGVVSPANGTSRPREVLIEAPE